MNQFYLWFALVAIVSSIAGAASNPPPGGKASADAAPCLVDLRAVAQLVSNTGAMRALKESSTECEAVPGAVSDFRAELVWTLSVADSREIALRPNFRVLALPEKAGSVRFDVVLRVSNKDRVLGSFSAYRADGSNLSPEEYKIGEQKTFSVVVTCDFLDGDGKEIAEMTVTRTYRLTSAGIEQIANQSGRVFSSSERALAATLDRLVSP